MTNRGWERDWEWGRWRERKREREGDTAYLWRLNGSYFWHYRTHLIDCDQLKKKSSIESFFGVALILMSRVFSSLIFFQSWFGWSTQKFSFFSRKRLIGERRNKDTRSSTVGQMDGTRSHSTSLTHTHIHPFPFKQVCTLTHTLTYTHTLSHTQI